MELWERYTYRVFWSEEDQEYVGVCAELPGLSWLEKSPESALRGIRKVAHEGLEMLAEYGDPIPEPLYDRKYSGIFKVRIPPETHRRLVLEASEQNVSLNRLVAAKLSAAMPAVTAVEIRESPAAYRAPKRKTRRSA